MQKFELTIPVELPKNLIILETQEFEKLRKAKEQGRWLSLDEVLQRVPLSRKTFTEKVLHNIKFKQELESFVHYPKVKGEKYYFLATKTIEFLETRFLEIMKEL